MDGPPAKASTCGQLSSYETKHECDRGLDWHYLNPEVNLASSTVGQEDTKHLLLGVHIK